VKRDEWTWFSPALDRDMAVCRWGHYGKPVVLFPTAGGDHLEAERFQLVRAVAPLIESGRIKVYTCGGISAEGWLDPDATPSHKTSLQARFDRYVADELLPFIRRESADTPQRFAAAGASLGAYNALTASTRHPAWFDLCVAMSGTYDFKRWVGDHLDDDYYFHMPIQFLPNLGEGPQLDQLRRARFVLATGQGRAEAPHETAQVANILKSKAIPHYHEVWGRDVHHDWPTWRTMLPLFLDKLV
jgi:esterase/lipase superfamily enzyme